MSDELSRFFGTLNQRLEDAMQAEQRALERFFVELGPRLETARTLESELDRQLARRFNVFDYLRTDELGLSRMIGDLLNPAGSHGQGAAFLQCLTKRLEFAKDCDLSGSKVDCERTITDGRRIDIAVKIDGQHCLAIENKANYADDQPDQVEDYLSWLEKYKEHLLVYLTPTGEGPSEGSVSGDTIEKLKRETPRRLVIMPCGPSGELDDTFNDLRLPFSLADWLADCRRDCDADRLRWFLREAEAFFHSMGGTTVTTEERKAVKDFILAHPENIATALAVYDSWPDISEKIKRNFLKLIRDELSTDTRWSTDTRCKQNYSKKMNGSYIYICPESWPPFHDPNGDETFTCIYMQANGKEGSNWSIGVSTISTSKLHEGDKERWKQLHKAFAKCGQQGGGSWLWWEWIEDEYRYWHALTPRLHQECQDGGGEITKYFVEKFKEVFDRAAPIIDSIDRR